MLHYAQLLMTLLLPFAHRLGDTRSLPILESLLPQSLKQLISLKSQPSHKMFLDFSNPHFIFSLSDLKALNFCASQCSFPPNNSMNTWYLQWTKIVIRELLGDEQMSMNE